MLVGNGSYALQVKHIAVGIAEGLGIHYLCVRLDGSLQSFQVVHVDDGVLDALCGQSMSNQIVGTAIEIVGSYDMVASLYDVLQSVGDGSGT